jgi:hypothetical protein
MDRKGGKKGVAQGGFLRCGALKIKTSACAVL